MTADLLDPAPGNIARSAQCLADGGLVAMPTETVYGLACDAANGEAVARLYAAKGRPSFNPLIAHVPDLAMAEREGRFNAVARRLADAFWPGPLTLVLPLAETHTVSALARAGLLSIGVRMPDHPVARALLEVFGRPLVAPSANPSGRISPTEARHVMADLGDRIDLVLNGGACRAGIESSIVSCLGEHPFLLRPGAVTREDIEAVLGAPLLQGEASEGAPTAPGQLSRHYAPRARLRLNAVGLESGEVLLGFGNADGTLNLSSSGDLVEAAANLFTMLRALDQTAGQIAVSPIPMSGLGLAINDRLARAAKRD